MVNHMQLIYYSTLLITATLIFICYTTFLQFITYSWRQTKELNMEMSLNIVEEELHFEKALDARKDSSSPKVTVTTTGGKTTSVAPVNNGTKGNSLSSIYKEGHLISNPNLCPDFGDGVKIIILITSAPDHYQARLAIRLTWGHFGRRSDIALAFVVGTTSNNETQAHIESESKLYGDIIQGHFVDTYENLTLKTLCMLEWVGRYCYKAHFFLKTDDDMFINVPKLLHFAETKWNAKRSIYGRLAVHWAPNRDPSKLYYISYEQFEPKYFPAFTTGPAYLVTMDSVRELYERTLQHIFVKLEDILVTGVIAQSLGISRMNAQEFVNGKISHTHCQVKGVVSVHGVNYDDQFELWEMSMNLKEC